MSVERLAELPPGMPPGAGDPARFAVETAAHALIDRGAALRGDAAAASLAAAMVEHAATAFQDGRHPDGFWITRLLREGRLALRATLGIAAGATPQAALDALLAAHAAFRRGDAQAAATALAPVASGGADPARKLATLEAPAPLRRALREARIMLARG